ncbi:MAG: DMT family transporter [Dehalococcoidia bacterium]
MNNIVQRGAYLALLTALVSGVSIFVNSFGVKQVSDPFVYTTAKNLLVGLALAALVVLPMVWRELRGFSARQWIALLGLGLIGGSLPFLLFFYGLREATAPSAAFIHKTLFIWVAILAVPLLKEQLGRIQILALAVLVIGNLVLLGRPAAWDLGTAELLIFVATLLWAAEAVLARRLMRDISTTAAALGRMGFGSLAMLAFLAASERVDSLVGLDANQWGWVLLTSVFLLAYVGSYYSALKRAPATLVASVLVLGSVVTSLLHAVFSGRTYTLEQVAGFGFILLAVVLWLYVGRKTSSIATPEVVHVRR